VSPELHRSFLIYLWPMLISRVTRSLVSAMHRLCASRTADSPGAAPRGIEPYDMFVKALATLCGEFVPVPGKDQIRTIA
jgi:hypothetical protein